MSDSKLTAAILRRKIAIQQPQRSSDGQGGYTKSWSNFACVFAGIESLSGFEKTVSFKVQSKITHRITIRYIAGVNSSMRVVMGTRSFNIMAVFNPQENNKILLLLCEEEAN